MDSVCLSLSGVWMRYYRYLRGMQSSCEVHKKFKRASYAVRTNFLSSPHKFVPWWRHQMETLSALVTGRWILQRPVTWSFDVFFNLRLNKRWSKQSRCRWFETPSRSVWRHCNDDFEIGYKGHVYYMGIEFKLLITSYGWPLVATSQVERLRHQLSESPIHTAILASPWMTTKL